MRQRLRDVLLADPSLLDDSSVTFLTLDVFSDQVEAGTVLEDSKLAQKP